MKPVWGLIRQHDLECFEIHLFADRIKTPGELCVDLSPQVQIHVIAGKSNEDAASIVEKAEIDILVDLNGFSFPRRLPLFVLRPAPVVAAWFNTYATTGLQCFQYLVGDNYVVPPDEERFYTEKIVRVPGSYLTFCVTYSVPPVKPLPSLQNGFITFGSLASQYKITDETIRTWARIVTACPQSRLLIRNACLKIEKHRGHLRNKFSSYGLAGDRLKLAGPAAHFEFLQTYDRIDIALDTFPYNGGTTSTEALWQGVPVVSYYGDRWVSRTSGSLLTNAGLNSLVAEDIEGYVRTAARLASGNSRRELAELRSNLRELISNSSLCDTTGFARAMEVEYRKMLVS